MAGLVLSRIPLHVAGLSEDLSAPVRGSRKEEGRVHLGCERRLAPRVPGCRPEDTLCLLLHGASSSMAVSCPGRCCFSFEHRCRCIAFLAPVSVCDFSVSLWGTEGRHAVFGSSLGPPVMPVLSFVPWTLVELNY